MEKKQRLMKFGIGASIFILALMSIQVKKKIEVSDLNVMFKKLPKFKSLDAAGNLVRSDDFRGKKLYIQFVNPLYDHDIALIKKVYFHWKNEDLIFIIITENYSRFQSKLADLNNVIVLSKNYKKLQSLFNVPDSGTHYLFDGSGTLVNIGRNDIEYDKGLKRSLNRLIKNKYFSISDFIKLNENIKEISWFKQPSEIVEKENKEFYVISLFTSICSGCKSGSIMKNLKSFHLKGQNYAYVVCILSDKFNENDIISLRSQLGIKFPVIIADQALSAKWNSLINEFSEAEVTDIIFIMDKSGKIIRVLDPNCKDCLKPFFLYMQSLFPN